MTLRSADIANRILDLVYPRWCEGCGIGMGLEEIGHICWDCTRAFALIAPPYCELCGDPCDGDLSGTYTCTLCRQHPPSFKLARSAVRYRAAVKDVIQGYKYRQAIHLTEDLGTLLEACFRATMPSQLIDAVVAVPLHPTRQRERTYNQSDLLANWLARRMNWDLGRDGLCRVRQTESQTTFSADQRRRNVRGAFEAGRPDWIQGRRLLLVDDVVTTGATLHECASVLMDAGAVSVVALTVARG